MTKRKSRDIIQSLSKKGFDKAKTDHIWFTFKYNGKKTSIRTKVSHGIQEYGDDLLSKMSGQLRLTKKVLLKFIDCPLSRDDYTSLMIERNTIED